METIKNYLENMFAGLPKTARILELKSNILSNMEEKYHELKRRGKSENEAIGIVISEFGNIDELLNEMGIQRNAESVSVKAISAEETEEYLKAKRKVGLMTGFGVFLCILGAAMLILISTLIEYNFIQNVPTKVADVLGVIVLLVFAAIATGFFIYSGLFFEPFKYIEEGVQLPIGVEADLKVRYEQFKPKFTQMLILAILMLVLSPISIFIGYLYDEPGSTFSVVILLIIVSIAVFILINTSLIKESYERLLKLGNYNTKLKIKNAKRDKVIGAVAAVVWPLAVIVFLLSGFIYDLWHIAWIVFPITGILFGIFSSVYSIITDNEKQ